MNEFIATTPDSVKLWGRTAGRGRVVIGIHGGLGLDSGYLWSALSPIRDQVQVVCFDQRGHGRSTGRDSLDQSTRETFVDDIDVIRRHVGAERVVLLGHSYGGFLALEYAARRPQAVAGVALTATSASLSHVPDALARVQTRARPHERDALDILLTNPPSTDADFGRLWLDVTPLYFADHDRSRGGVFADTIFSAAGYCAGSRALAGYDMSDRLSDIGAPVALFHGANDWLMGSETAGAELASGLPHARRFTFAKSGHYPFLEEPQLWTSTLSKWFSDLG